MQPNATNPIPECPHATHIGPIIPYPIWELHRANMGLIKCPCRYWQGNTTEYNAMQYKTTPTYTQSGSPYILNDQPIFELHVYFYAQQRIKMLIKTNISQPTSRRRRRERQLQNKPKNWKLIYANMRGTGNTHFQSAIYAINIGLPTIKWASRGDFSGKIQLVLASTRPVNDLTNAGIRTNVVSPKLLLLSCMFKFTCSNRQCMCGSCLRNA